MSEATNMLSGDDLGRSAYLFYKHYREKLSAEKVRLPMWEELKPEVQIAWNYSAVQTLEFWAKQYLCE